MLSRLLPTLTVPGLAAIALFACASENSGDEAATTASAAGCQKDVDCKGDRICVDGRCVAGSPAGEDPQAEPGADNTDDSDSESSDDDTTPNTDNGPGDDAPLEPDRATVDGVWLGASDTEEEVVIRVCEGEVVAFGMPIQAEYGGNTCEGTAELIEPTPIVGSVAELRLRVANAHLGLDLTVEFLDEQARGTAAAVSNTGLQCDSPPILSAGTADAEVIQAFSFAAERVESDCDAVLEESMSPTGPPPVVNPPDAPPPSVGCPPGELLCGTECVSVLFDIANCGACGYVCAPGTMCTMGECEAGDPPEMDPEPDTPGSEADCGFGEVVCGDICTDVNFDDANCGECGYVCPPGTMGCAAGECQSGQ